MFGLGRLAKSVAQALTGPQTAESGGSKMGKKTTTGTSTEENQLTREGSLTPKASLLNLHQGNETPKATPKKKKSRSKSMESNKVTFYDETHLCTCWCGCPANVPLVCYYCPLCTKNHIPDVRRRD